MDESSFLKQRLTEASRTKDTTRRLSLLFATAAIAIFVLLLVALVDYWIILPASTRFGGIALLAVIFAVAAFKFAATIKRPTPLKEAALDAEARKPEAGLELSTAAEYLSGERKAEQEYESALAAALEAKAANHLKTAQVPYWNRSIPAALLLGGCAVAGLMFVLAASGGFTAFKRAAAPWSNTPYTTVEVKPGNVEIPIGKDVDIKSIFAGRVPKTARFSWQDEGSPKWQFAALTRNESGEYVYPLKNVRAPVNYRVSGSDAISPAFKVEPYIPPEVKEWRVELQSPAYTKRTKTVQTAPDISVFRGSTASLWITPSTKLSQARIRFEEGQSLELKPTENGFWTTDLAISKDAKFWIELADAKGHTSTNDERYQIAALPDEAPKVEIPEPGQDMRADATNTVPVKISVTDDFGLQEIKLVYHKLGAPEQSIVAKRNGETNTDFTAEIPLSSLGLQDFELVAYHAEATDNNTLDGPGVGKSDVYFIEITNQEGGKCKSQGKSQRVNLLVIQKQIIADTTALAANATPEKFDELAKRQKDAVDFGNIYTKALSTGPAGPALAEMQSAVADMEKAQGALEKQLRAEALPPAESALAHLYAVLKSMPELKDLPTKPQQMKNKTNQPPMLNVVLNAMKKDRKDEADNAELEQTLKQAQELQDEQSSLNIGVQSSGQGKDSGESQLVRAGNESKAAPAKAKGKGKGKGKAKGKGAAKNGQAKGNGEGKGSGEGAGKGEGNGKGKPDEAKPEQPKQDQPKDDEPKDGDQPDEDQLAEKQTELSKDAAELAEKLERLANHNQRLGHNAAAKMKQASNNMTAAAEAMRSGNKQTAGTKGAESGMAVADAIATIQRALNAKPERVDVSQEESPKEYEMIIAEYLKKLSYEE